MSKTPTIRVDRSPKELKRLAQQRHTSVAETVDHAARLLRQEQIGHDLAQPMSDDERAWLNADLG